MPSMPRIVAVAAAGVALLTASATTSCTRYVEDAQVVPAPDLGRAPAAAAADCTSVEAPLTTIPTATGEPVMKIPQPKGWKRSTMMDSELIRFMMGNRDLTQDNFAPTAVVTLESDRGITEADEVFDAERHSLQSGFGATDLEVTKHTLCGLPAETIHYVTPAMGTVGPHPAVVVCVVLHTEDATYAASVTVQTTDPQNRIFKNDAEQILTGFQMLPPAD